VDGNFHKNRLKEFEEGGSIMPKCDWCKKATQDLFKFTFEDDGEEAYVCEERLEDIEREFYKKGERA